MNPIAYIETSVLGYLTSRPSRDVVVTAYQQVTREWWRDARDRFHLVASELVVAEAGAGDEAVARARLAALEAVTLLEATEDAANLPEKLLDLKAVPRRAAEDAAHIAIAVTHGVHYGNSGTSQMPPCALGSNGCVVSPASNRPSSALPTN